VSLEAQLDRLVPPPEQAFGDWSDVLRRAGIAKRTVSGKLLAGAVGVALLVALFATPAFGLLLDLIGRTNVPFDGRRAPTRVQRTFFDMSISAPRGMGPDAIASQTRRVGVLGGRALYVAPTRGGGFCWQFERGFGGCDTHRRQPLSAAWSMLQHRGGPLLVREVGGEVIAPDARTLTVEYADGTTSPIPFIWVTKPIDAGFFLYAVPASHQHGTARAAAVVARDGHGKVIARERMIYARPPHLPPRATKPPRGYRPPPPLPAPTAPLQRGSAAGVSVIVGANGIAEFHVANPALRGASWGCLRFMRYHRTTPFELGYAAQAIRGDRIALNGMGAPVDGCEVQGTYGHVWPDPHGYHSAVEIAFTAQGRRFFADRAAARELALYMRWSKHHPNAPTTGLTVTRRGPTTTYSVRSASGKRFFVTVRGGRIVRENVRPYAGPL
jgi:hypothetical protein